MHLKPAQYVIKSFGGVRSVARLLKVQPSTVARWGYPKGKRQGREGFVPYEYFTQILLSAKRKGVDVSLNDLISGRDV